MKKVFVFVLAAFLIVSFASVSHARVLVKGASVVKIGENINMGEGMMFKDLVAIKGDVNVKGDVGGDVIAVMGVVHLYPKARVAGDVISVGGNVIKENGALVKGETVNLPLAGKEGAKMESYAPMIAMLGVGGVLMLKALMFLGFVGLSMIIISFWMKNVGVISSVVEKQWLRVFLWDTRLHIDCAGSAHFGHHYYRHPADNDRSAGDLGGGGHGLCFSVSADRQEVPAGYKEGRPADDERSAVGPCDTVPYRSYPGARRDS